VQPGQRWRQCRKIMHPISMPANTSNFHPHQTNAIHNLLRRVLHEPQEGVMTHLRQCVYLTSSMSIRLIIHLSMAGEIIILITYGIKVKEYDDPFIIAAEKGVRAAFQATIPGSFLVDMMPWLRWVPEWMPGAGFQKVARECKEQAEIMLNDPLNATKRDVVRIPKELLTVFADYPALSRQTVQLYIHWSQKFSRRKRWRAKSMKKQNTASSARQQLSMVVIILTIFPSIMIS
jgi:hypothetical protein